MEVVSYLLGKKAGGGSGPTPTGTIDITENGTHDVTNYASANVNVSGSEFTITHSTQSDKGMYQIIEEIAQNNIITLTATSCAYMFEGYSQNTIPKLNDTSKVTNMIRMFRDCYYVKNFNLDNYDTSNVTDMRGMFSNSTGSSQITTLDLSNFNTSKVTQIGEMFYNLRSVAVLDISSFDFTNVTNSNSMFELCGRSCLTADGAYANGIPYVYVKDVDAQNFVLSTKNVPSTWTTDNVIIKNN